MPAISTKTSLAIQISWIRGESGLSHLVITSSAVYTSLTRSVAKRRRDSCMGDGIRGAAFDFECLLQTPDPIKFKQRRSNSVGPNVKMNNAMLEKRRKLSMLVVMSHVYPRGLRLLIG